MEGGNDTFGFRLLNEFQRGFPVTERPFARLAQRLSAKESDVITALTRMVVDGVITRVGAIVRPNTAGASTLAAMAVPEHDLNHVTEALARLPGVNHAYLREDPWNLWFVVTAPDTDALEADLRLIAATSGQRVLDLRLVRAFHIDLGFSLTRGAPKPAYSPEFDISVLREDDKPLLQMLCRGLPLVEQPYARLADDLGWPAARVLERITALCAAGIVTRFGVIVRHRELGWAANAMVVWRLPDEKVPAAGHALARLDGVSLCYERRAVPELWPYPLYTMVHARSRGEALAIVAEAAALPELANAAHKVLFSTHCFKQTGAWLLRREAAA